MWKTEALVHCWWECKMVQKVLEYRYACICIGWLAVGMLVTRSHDCFGCSYIVSSTCNGSCTTCLFIITTSVSIWQSLAGAGTAHRRVRAREGVSGRLVACGLETALFCSMWGWAPLFLPLAPASLSCDARVPRFPGTAAECRERTLWGWATRGPPGFCFMCQLNSCCDFR